MKTREITISAPKVNVELTGLECREAEGWDDIVTLCGGKEDAAVGAFMAGWVVKAQSYVRGKVESNQKDEENKLEGDDLFKFAQDALNEYVYTGVRERKAKKKVKVSKAALKERGASAADLKSIDKLLELLGDQVEVTD